MNALAHLPGAQMRPIPAPEVPLSERDDQPPEVVLSWGDDRLDQILPPLRVGVVHLLLQERRESRLLLPRVAASELAKGRVIHWVDGAGRIDPGHLVPLLHWRGCDVKEGLSRLRISRGHTAHQLAAQIERLAAVGEASPVGVRIVIVDQLATMFSDPQFSKAEGRAMLRRSLGHLTTLAEQRGVCVLLSASRLGNPPLPTDHEGMLKRNSGEVYRIRSLELNNRRSRLPGGETSGLSLIREGDGVRHIWQPLPWNQASLLDFTANDSRESGRLLPRLIPSSSQPKGESIAQTARSAKGA